MNGPAFASLVSAVVVVGSVGYVFAVSWASFSDWHDGMMARMKHPSLRKRAFKDLLARHGALLVVAFIETAIIAVLLVFITLG